MTTYFWTIAQMERLTYDGFVLTVHYNVSATDEIYQTSIYGSISYVQTPGEAYIPYKDLTQDIVVGWVQEALGKDTVEDSLQSQINVLKNPVQAFGLPW